MIFKFIKRRSDDKSIFKYFLPYGYMRRHLARTYGFVVEGGDFKSRPVIESDIKGFRFEDLLPLFVVMRLQDKKEGPIRIKAKRSLSETNDLESKISELNRDHKLLSAEVSNFQKKMCCEIERLSVENMRLEMKLKELCNA